MKKFLFFIVTIILSGASAWAAGIGIYGTGGATSGTWSNEYGDSSSGTTTFYGGGLIVDSAVAKNSLFNYRFKIG